MSTQSLLLQQECSLRKAVSGMGQPLLLWGAAAVGWGWLGQWHTTKVMGPVGSLLLLQPGVGAQPQSW